MKIFEVIQESDNTGRTGAEKAAYLQRVARTTGSFTGTDAADMIGKSDFGGLDPEEVLQRKRASGREKRADDFEKQTQARRAEIDQKFKDREKEKADLEREQRREKRQKRQQKAAELRRQDRDAGIKKANKKAQDDQDAAKGYRKDSAGRVLRAPRYYPDGRTPTGKRIGNNAIATGIRSFLYNPTDTISQFYTDRVDKVKKFLKTKPYTVDTIKDD